MKQSLQLLFLTGAITIGSIAISCHRQRQPLQTNTPVFTSFCAPTSAVLSTPPGFDGTLTPLFAGLTENFTYPVTTKSKAAQKYFDQGLILAYGFNHAEAARSFKEAARQDPDCAMCYWGLGYVLGPNYNSPMDANVLPEANMAVMDATLRMNNATPKEKGLINALAKRYPKSKEEDAKPFHEAYANALGEVRKQFPNDLDIDRGHARRSIDGPAPLGLVR